ncbi:MAG: HEAT repeat domain-containing protein [Candidatus Omnitrophica bacterium]|nr:HEAT repeat domain-containing protein [Candidatus Omnitrophota bacterium]
MSRPRAALLTILMALGGPLAPVAAEAPAAARGSPSPQAVEAMRLLESEDPYQRQLGFLRLEALREPATIEAISRYLTHREPEVRAYSLRALGAVQGVGAVPVLLTTLATEKHPRVRRAALLALEPLETSTPDILPALVKALRDRKPEVRITAIDIVSRIDAPQAKEAILLRHRRERDRDVRRVLASAMKRIGR